jgi:glyoxylase-like metal-dependent hydrolase (beta-lactamase superfamily II)
MNGKRSFFDEPLQASTQAAAVPYKTHTSKNGVLAHTFFHDATSTWQYLVADDLTKTAVLIDPVLDFDAATLKVTTDTADSLVGFLQQNKYQLRHILETHAHADHLTAAQYFKTQFQAPVGIGAGILAVQKRAAADYDIPADELQGVFDNLWENGQTFQLGRNELAVMHLPGHTPDHVG